MGSLFYIPTFIGKFILIQLLCKVLLIVHISVTRIFSHIMDLKSFETFLDSINRCYAKEVTNDLPKLTDFPSDIVSSDTINLTKLAETLNNHKNIFFKSVSLRLIAIKNLQECREKGLKPELKLIWKLICDSISILPSEAVVSSIGSQGFLSIPLYKYDKEPEMFDFFRLHIWDKSLEKHINIKTRDDFSIHTHSFYAESWILCGRIINERFAVKHSPEPTDYSIFNIEYNKTLNEINKHTSTARNAKQFMECKQISTEQYLQGGNYVIEAGDYHKSSVDAGNDGVAATLFNFYAPKGRVEHSFVIGPSNIKNSEINRTENIDPKDVIRRIDEII